MNGEDGSIIIGTIIDDKEFYKKIKEYENTKIKDFEIDPKLNVKQLQNEIIKVYQGIREKRNQEIISQDELNGLQLFISFIEKANSRIEELGGNKVIIPGLNDANADMEELKEWADLIDLSETEKSLKNIGKSVDNVARKVTRWALAVFGVRSAYSAIRGAMSTLSQYDEQMATNIEYIRFVLASALKPIIETIINLVYELLRAINYIAQAWFGVNLFANATADAFKKADQNAGKLRKTMFGFDKANILQDSGSTSKGGGVGGVIPSLEFGEGEVPEWVKWIAENKDLVIDGLMAIAGGLIAIKLGLDGIQALGITSALIGISLLIQDIIKFIDDPSWEGFFNILGDIAIAIGGIMLIMGNWWGLLIVIIGAIVKLVADNWDTISEFLGGIWRWIDNNVISPIVALFQGMWNIILAGVDIFTYALEIAFRTIKAIVLAPVNLLIDAINVLISGLNKISIDVPDWVPIIGGDKWGFDIPKIPKLAKGGIINMPGKGVPIGASAIGGEYGAEWVQPLTDESALERVGSAIGKHVKVSVDFTAEIEGRVFARVMKELNNDSSFARNGG